MHCTSGKDRTGFAATAVLLAVGVPREVIVGDYALTNDFRRGVNIWRGVRAGRIPPKTDCLTIL
jgi:protein tyrosine/serine phosphatase